MISLEVKSQGHSDMPPVMALNDCFLVLKKFNFNSLYALTMCSYSIFSDGQFFLMDGDKIATLVKFVKYDKNYLACSSIHLTQ